MMEKVDINGQEEYIWAMRSLVKETSDYDLWLNRLQDYSSVAVRKDSKDVDLCDEVDQQTQILASLVPNEIIYDHSTFDTRQYDGCLLIGKIKGFAELCDKYDKVGKGGPSRLNQLMNRYLGGIVQDMMSFTGDVLRFGGAGFLSLFKTSATTSVQDCVHLALDCALKIMKTYGSYETELEVTLTMKIMITSGEILFSLIGFPNMCCFILHGQSISDMKIAEKHTKEGEIIVTNMAWTFINPSEYHWDMINQEQLIRVRGLGLNWRSPLRTGKKDRVVQQETESESHASNDDDMDDLESRPAISYAGKMSIQKDLRKFILPVVMRCLDMDEPLDYLIEKRQIVVVFINIVSKPDLEFTQFAKFVNKCYTSILSISDPKDGSVQVCFYHKDLAFLAVFGFRGFRHENDSQVGLHCASECFSKLKDLEDLDKISISVATGPAYCGMVGDKLRREFTVVGSAVDHALLLVQTFTDRVVCDRDTFLNSKLEAKNFILQDYCDVKDMKSFGPVYEFLELKHIFGMERTLATYPLLGREEEQATYLEMLGTINRESRLLIQTKQSSTIVHKTLYLIVAEAKLGKSRLIDEFIYITPDHVPICRYRLVKEDQAKPFNAIRLVFRLPLCMDEENSAQKLENKIRNRLRFMLVPELLCVLNEVFQVNYPISPLYRQLTDEENQIVQQKMIKQLCYGTFANMWSVLLENVEFMDAESWPLIMAMSETALVMITLTSCEDEQLNGLGLKLLNDSPRVHRSQLMSLDKWYHAGIACQILKVYAIPPDLEKVIQSKSNGNPGWIESFLITLVQSESLIIQEVEKDTIYDQGLIMPPMEMIIRIDSKELKELQKYRNTADGWKMYMTTYRDSRSDVTKSTSNNAKELLKVCLIAPGIDIWDVDAEYSTDKFVMKLFDALTSFEQRLVKCSAIVGETFHRKMVEHVVNSKDTMTTAKAICKLFELQVFSCARGDFTLGPTFSIRQKRDLFEAIPVKDISCECIGFTVSDLPHQHNLPHYALCGLIRFKISNFRTIMLALLSDEQKVEFHTRAMQYLEMESRKCFYCGSALFSNIVGNKYKYNDEFRNRLKARDRRRVSPNFDEITLLKVPIDEDDVDSSRNKLIRRDTVQNVDVISRISIFEDQSAEFLLQKPFGIQIVNACRWKPNLMKSFAENNFSKCQCAEILETIYTQMTDHCIGANIRDKVVTVLLEFAQNCITSFNVPQAFKCLKLALEYVKKISHDDTKDWQVPLLKAQISMLTGYARFELGQYNEALVLFYNAMIDYGYPFPTNANEIKFRRRLMKMKIVGAMVCCSRQFLHSKSGSEAQFCDNVSFCLIMMCNVFKLLRMWPQALLAAEWSFVKALTGDQDFPNICNAYANVIHMLQHFKDQSLCIALEVHALCACHRKKNSVDKQDLIAVVNLYTAIFRTRFERSEIHACIDIGYAVSNICSSINEKRRILNVYPLLIQALIILVNVDEAAGLLSEMQLVIEEDVDNSGGMWYYALSLQLHVETGYSYMTYAQCEKFLNVEGEHTHTDRDPASKRRYFTMMWLWCIRIQNYEAANIWQVKAHDLVVLQQGDTLENLFTGLYHLEGMLLYIADKADRKNFRAVTQNYIAVDHLIQILDKSVHHCKVFEPRLAHLKAYYRLIRYNDKRTFTMLNTARNLAIKRANLFEEHWINHSDLAWNNDMSTLKRNFWREHSTDGGLLYYHEFTVGGSLVPFTLEPPQFL